MMCLTSKLRDFRHVSVVVKLASYVIQEIWHKKFCCINSYASKDLTLDQYFNTGSHAGIPNLTVGLWYLTIPFGLYYVVSYHEFFI